MKKPIFVASLIPLILLEIYLSTIFLPVRWQQEINRAIVHLVPETHDWTPVTHPMIGQEIEQVLREHVWLKLSLYLITLLLLAVNGWTIYRLLRLLRSGRFAQRTV
jgi:hypothetical protein